VAKLPTIVSSIPRDLRMFLDRVREALSANGDDALVTLKSLETYGLVQRQGNMVTALAQNGDFATPPAPLNLTADGALASIILSWDTPQYRGHAYTEIWAAQEPVGGGVPDLGEAVLVGMSPGTVFSHNLGAGTTRWYWIRFVNVADEAGPYNAVDGVEASTAGDPGYLMDVLSEVYGTGSASPYFYLSAPQTINGVTVPAGTYMYDAFIYNGSITNAKIGDAAIDTAKITDAAITTAKIGDAQITTAKIGNAQVDTANIKDAAITTAKIANAQITNALIADATIDLAKIDTASINDLSSLSANIGTITAGKMQSSDGKFVIDLNNTLITITV
jgi:predicted phage tail protein